MDDTSPATCGLGCEACPGITDGEATCDGRRCGVNCPAGKQPCVDRCIAEGTPCGGCPPGTNLCGGVCAPATSLSACGSACATCPFSRNGTSTCDGDKCQLTCEPGYHAAATAASPTPTQ